MGGRSGPKASRHRVALDPGAFVDGTDVIFNGKDVGKCGKIDWSHVALGSCLHSLEFRRLVLHCWIRVMFCNLQKND